MVYRIWENGPLCPHCNTQMRTDHYGEYSCPVCHSRFVISEKAMASDCILGSGEMWVDEIYRGPSVKDED